MDVLLVGVSRRLAVEGHVTKPAGIRPGIGVGVNMLGQIVPRCKSLTTMRTVEWLLVIRGMEVHHVISGKNRQT